MSEKMPIELFWKYAPDWVATVAMDKNGSCWAFGGDIEMVPEEWRGKKATYVLCDLDLGDDWTKSKRERPGGYASMVGMYGKFWDEDREPSDSNGIYGYLEKHNDSAAFPFLRKGSNLYRYFRPMVPAARLEVKP